MWASTALQNRPSLRQTTNADFVERASRYQGRGSGQSDLASGKIVDSGRYFDGARFDGISDDS